ncbi:AfsR/SARP family transcriptional regulator [Actinoplanes couchii]|uniref:SARP family transcriptional regulator n=1 Tax=Actinoplanes couchii TaxID=403638 RepID=A0ABQ3XNT1_9ACTN|nr:BTAD domain-containing putative transcriptional regulator [Actinoplanes couchii]MDR6319603.1 DNA-binding SARP family transcriptional activator/tetratricopeptide (TPR) repeat protein [Actinoplanes couchii]GID60174.1 SARP family transcriptional regulator [Actinoplanes couchii]
MTDPDVLRLQIMGPLRVWRGDAELDTGPRQQRCLLAVLLANEGRPVGMGDLIDLLWGSSPPVSAVNVIHKYIGALRRLLEPELATRVPGSFLARHDNGYRFSAGPDVLDLVAFRRLTARAREAEDTSRLSAALDDYTRALHLCQGAAGGNLADSAAASATFAGIDGEFHDAVVAAASVAQRVGDPNRVLAPLRTAARTGRLHEPVHAALVETLAAAGHQAEALDAYRSVRERLADELGIDPGRELQQAQQRVLTQSGAAPAGSTLVRPAQLPPDQPLFVGRRHEMAMLHDHMTAMRDSRRTSPMVVAVDGMGGVGKSTVVAHFAHRVAADFTDGQLHLDLRGHEGESGSVPALDALRSLLYALGLRGADVPDSLDALVGAYRTLTAGKRFLVMLDDAHDAGQVRPLLPNSADSLVLITSRRPLVGLAVSDGARLHRAHLPDLPDARRILTTRLTCPHDPAFLDEIIELCGRLPLALAVLAARLSVRPKLSMATVVAELRDGARRLAAFGEGRGVTDPRTAFSWSYRQLSPDAARLFRLLSQAPVAGITAEAAASLSGADLTRTRSELEELAEAALVTEQDSGCFTAHVLVRAYAEELFRTIDTPADQRAGVARLLQYYLHSSYNAQVVLAPNRTPIPPARALPGVAPEEPLTYQQAIAWFARHRPVLKEAVGLAADLGHGIVPWQMAITMQQYFEWYGYFQDWDDVMRSALHAARTGGDIVGEAHVLRSLAGARWFLGANEESLELLAAALDVFVDHCMLREQALTHINVHAVHTSLGAHEKALASAETAVALCRAAGNETSLMRSLDCKGRSLARLGRHDDAAPVLAQALAINQRIGRRHEEAMIRVSIADNLVGLKRTNDAVAELRRAADAARSVGQGPYHFQAFRSLSALLLTLGDDAGARQAFDRASEVLGSFQGGGPRHMREQLEQLAHELAGAG